VDIAVAASYALAKVAHTVKKVRGGWYEWQARSPHEQRLFPADGVRRHPPGDPNRRIAYTVFTPSAWHEGGWQTALQDGRCRAAVPPAGVDRGRPDLLERGTSRACSPRPSSVRACLRAAGVDWPRPPAVHPIDADRL